MLVQQINQEIRKLEDKIRDLQTRYAGELTVLNAKKAALTTARDAITPEIEAAVVSLAKIGIIVAGQSK